MLDCLHFQLLANLFEGLDVIFVFGYAFLVSVEENGIVC